MFSSEIFKTKGDNMKKKILILCIITIFLASIAAVSAVSTDDHESKGVHYNIPNGYTFSDKSSSHNTLYDTCYDDGTVYKYNNGVNTVEVYIYDLRNPSNSIDDISYDFVSSYEKTTINGVDGYYATFSEGEKFLFVENGKLVRIVAPNKALIESMVPSGVFSIFDGFDIPDIDIPNLI